MDIKWRGIKFILAEEACEHYIECFNMGVASIVYTPVKPEDLEKFLKRISPNISFMAHIPNKSINGVTLRNDSIIKAANRVNRIYYRMKKVNPESNLIIGGIFLDEFNKIGVRLYKYEKE